MRLMMSDDYCYLNKWYNTYKATNANCTHSTLYTVLLYCTIFSVFAWQGCGWTWSCTLVWCCMKTWKIFVCEAIEIIILRGGPVLPHQKGIWGSKTKHKVGTRVTTKKTGYNDIRALQSYSLCVLCPNRIAVSLSTIMTVIANRDTPYNA